MIASGGMGTRAAPGAFQRCSVEERGSGKRVPSPVDTVAALQRLNAPRSAEILRGACSLFPGGSPPDSMTRREMMVDRLVEELDELTRRLYHSDEDLLAALAAYHEAVFGR